MKDDDCAGDLGFAADDDLEGKYDYDDDLQKVIVLVMMEKKRFT